ncbi:hypothetical protein FBU30_008410 [Linnemannia zychae]|nr:hypothetical protein FBU30_008410 [Linnemannia zychae]
MGDNVYAKISERMKNEQFTEDEIRIVEKAKGQLSTYTTGGSIVGGAAGLMLAKAKNMKGIPGLMVAAGGFLIGSQIGVIMGAMASVRTIQTIPNFQRIVNIVQEVREDGATGGPRGGRSGPLQHDRAATMPSAGTQRFPVQPRLGSELMTDDAVAQQIHPDHDFKTGDGYHGGQDPNASVSQNTVRSDSAWAHVDQRAKELHEKSPGWTEIRRQNMPRSAWTDIREGRKQTSSSSTDTENDDDHDRRNHDGLSDNKQTRSTLSTARTTSWDRVRRGEAGSDGFVGARGSSLDGPSEFPRTREDLENKPSRQKNRYGDAL